MPASRRGAHRPSLFGRRTDRSAAGWTALLGKDSLGPMKIYSKPTFASILGLFAALLLTVGGPLAAQPAAPGDSVAFEVQSIDRQNWVVTARDLESGEVFAFRLPPEAFRGQRFEADLDDAASGKKISVQGARGARLDKAVIERPIGAGSPSRGRPEGDTRFDRDRAPGPADYGSSPERRGPADYLQSNGRPGGGSGPSEYEVLSVDSRTWTVQARGRNGRTVSLEVDPQAFVGYRFRASVEDLRAGQGFELLATNEQPLANCCVVKIRPGR